MSLKNVDLLVLNGIFVTVDAENRVIKSGGCAIKDGKITDIVSGNESIQNFARKEVFETDTEFGMRIGELGLPANLYVLARNITGNLMIDEKGRVHIANGHGYQARTGCEYDTPVHGDGLIACATLKAVNLDKVFMEDNVYSPGIFTTLR